MNRNHIELECIKKKKDRVEQNGQEWQEQFGVLMLLTRENKTNLQ